MGVVARVERMDFSQAVVASDEAWVKPRMRMVAGVEKVLGKGGRGRGRRVRCRRLVGMVVVEV